MRKTPDGGRHGWNARAPIRVCDIGGWTDTWFARSGAVFNIAVLPDVEVQIEALGDAASPERVTISVENFGAAYQLDPDHPTYERHPLIAAAIDVMSVPPGRAFTINIFSEAPPGASTGTSAAVSVALIGALAAANGRALTAHEAATLAHALETERLGLQSGIQDQLASAYGGINFIEMHAYPHASVSPVPLAAAIRWELEQRLVVVYVGRPHHSSEVHQKVIASLGENAHQDGRLQRLRELAHQAKATLMAGDLASFGRVMDENTAVQRALHPALVGDKFEEILSIARDFDVLGCKVNGAGGDGGSMTILTGGDMAWKRQMITALRDRGYHSLPVRLSRRGLRVWS